MRLSLFLFLCLLFIVCPLCVATYDASLHISTVHSEHHHQHGTRRAEGISIVGGYSTDIASHPYQVGFWSDQFNVVTCGGSLLSPEWVITAAHCIGSRKVSLGSRVYVGMTHLSARDTDPHVQTAQVLRTFVHPQYSKTYLSNDIALVHLDHPIQISPYVQPISIYQPTDEMTSILSAPYTILNSLQNATLSGWGVWRSGTSVTPDSLQQVNVTIIDQDICIQEWAKVAVPIHQFNQICSWDSSPVRSHCNGDSGGPLVTGLSVQQLVGIVSGGPDTCNGNLPSVYTRVHQYVDWIFAMTGVSSAEAATPTNVPTSAKLTLPSSLQLKQDADLNSLGTP